MLGDLLRQENETALGDDLISDLAGFVEHAREFESSHDPESERRHEDRLPAGTPVMIRPGSTSQRAIQQLVGKTRDTSSLGFGAVFASPPLVGDVYLATFEDSKSVSTEELPPDETTQESGSSPAAFARCMRCQLIREEAFEAGFKFLTEFPGN